MDALVQAIRQHSDVAEAYTLNHRGEQVGIELVLGGWIEPDAKTVGVAMLVDGEWRLQLAVLRATGREFVKFVPVERIPDSGDLTDLARAILTRFSAMGDRLLVMLDAAAEAVSQSPRT